MWVIPSDLPDIDKMGIEPDLIRAYAEMGLVLVCGPTGSGKQLSSRACTRRQGQKCPTGK
jgi:defect-in-organelle-trafficking protein DotB